MVERQTTVSAAHNRCIMHCVHTNVTFQFSGTVHLRDKKLFSIRFYVKISLRWNLFLKIKFLPDFGGNRQIVFAVFVVFC